MNLRKLAVCLLVAAGIFGLQAQQQNPSAADQPAQQPAQQGPQIGARENGSSTNQQPTAQNNQSNPPIPEPVREMIRGFLAIGAPPDPAAEKRGQTLFVAPCGFCHGSNATGAPGPD